MKCFLPIYWLVTIGRNLNPRWAPISQWIPNLLSNKDFLCLDGRREKYLAFSSWVATSDILGKLSCGFLIGFGKETVFWLGWSSVGPNYGDSYSQKCIVSLQTNKKCKTGAKQGKENLAGFPYSLLLSTNQQDLAISFG